VSVELGSRLLLSSTLFGADSVGVVDAVSFGVPVLPSVVDTSFTVNVFSATVDFVF